MTRCPVRAIGTSCGPIGANRESCFPNGRTSASRLGDMLVMRAGDMLAIGVRAIGAVEISINYGSILENLLH